MFGNELYKNGLAPSSIADPYIANCLQINGNVYWVDSVNGNDSNPGTEQKPFASLLAALSAPPPGAITLHANFNGGSKDADIAAGSKDSLAGPTDPSIDPGFLLKGVSLDGNLNEILEWDAKGGNADHASQITLQFMWNPSFESFPGALGASGVHSLITLRDPAAAGGPAFPHVNFSCALELFVGGEFNATYPKKFACQIYDTAGTAIEQKDFGLFERENYGDWIEVQLNMNFATGVGSLYLDRQKFGTDFTWTPFVRTIPTNFRIALNDCVNNTTDVDSAEYDALSVFNNIQNTGASYSEVQLEYAPSSNIANGDLIVIKENHSELLNRSIAIQNAVQIFGLGAGGSRPKFTTNVAGLIGLKVQAANSGLIGLKFPQGLIAQNEAQVEISAANVHIRDCDHEMGQYDKNGVKLSAGAVNALLDSLAMSSEGDQPESGVLVDDAGVVVHVKDCAFNGKDNAWSKGAIYSEVAHTYNYENLNLTNGSKVHHTASAVGYISNPSVDENSSIEV